VFEQALNDPASGATSAADQAEQPGQVAGAASQEGTPSEKPQPVDQTTNQQAEMPQVGAEQQEAQQTPQGQEGQGQNGRADEEQESPLVAVLRQQVIDAMDPVLDDLRENIEEAVEQQIDYVLKMGEDELHRQVNQAIEPLRNEVQQQTDQTVQDAKQEREKPQQTKLQEAVQRTVKALKKTMQWLARTLRALLRTVVELLKAVVNLVIVILLALFEGLKSLGGAAGHGLQAIGSGILKKMVGGLAKKLGKSLMPEPEAGKQQQPEQPSKAAA
jgi:hypothetical protein